MNNKLFSSSLVLLLLVSLLGAGCSSGNPNTPTNGLANITSLLEAGSDVKTPAVGSFVPTGEARLEFSFKEKVQELLSSKAVLVSIEDEDGKVQLNTNKWSVELTETGIIISTFIEEETSKLYKDIVLNVVIKLTSPNDEAEIILYGKLIEVKSITSEQILTEIKKLLASVDVKIGNTDKSIKFDFSKVNGFEETLVPGAYAYRILIEGEAGTTPPDAENNTLSRATLLAKLKEELTAKLTGSTEILAVGNRPNVEVQKEMSKNYLVSVKLEPNFGYDFPFDFTGVAIEFDLNSKINNVSCKFSK